MAADPQTTAGPTVDIQAATGVCRKHVGWFNEKIDESYRQGGDPTVLEMQRDAIIAVEQDIYGLVGLGIGARPSA